VPQGRSRAARPGHPEARRAAAARVFSSGEASTSDSRERSWPRSCVASPRASGRSATRTTAPVST
jgi:hypothetical protein